jgi:DNA-directed RNA polymerase subunit N (RpoN/RPB10)
LGLDPEDILPDLGLDPEDILPDLGLDPEDILPDLGLGFLECCNVMLCWYWALIIGQYLTNPVAVTNANKIPNP